MYRCLLLTALAGCSSTIADELRFFCTSARECAPDWYCVDSICSRSPPSASGDAAVDMSRDAAVVDMGALDMQRLALPDQTLPDRALPDRNVRSDTGLDRALPDMRLPDMRLPDMRLPDIALPDAAIVDHGRLDMRQPDMAIPDAAVVDQGPPDALPDAAPPACIEGQECGLEAPVCDLSGGCRSSILHPIKECVDGICRHTNAFDDFDESCPVGTRCVDGANPLCQPDPECE